MPTFFLIIFVLLSAVLHGQINHIQPLMTGETDAYYLGGISAGKQIFAYRGYFDNQNARGIKIELLDNNGTSILPVIFDSLETNQNWIFQTPSKGIISKGDTAYFIITRTKEDKSIWLIGAIAMQQQQLIYLKPTGTLEITEPPIIFPSLKGGVYIAYGILNSTKDKSYLRVRKLDSSGDLVWDKDYEPSTRLSADYALFLRGAVECQNGDVLLSGNWKFNASNFNYKGAGFLARVNEQGVVWKKNIDIPEYKNERIFDVLELPNGNIVLCEGKRVLPDKLGNRVRPQIKLYSGDGQQELGSHYVEDLTPDSSINYYSTLKQLKNGDFIALGKSFDYADDTSFGPYQHKVLVTRYTASGLAKWTHVYSNSFAPHGNVDNQIYSIVEVPSTDSLLFIGSSYNYDINQLRPWVFKTDGKGCIAANCEAVGIAVPYTVEQTLQVYPTPTSGGFTVISSSLKKEALHVYNMQGKLMKTGVVSKHAPWSMEEQLPPGLYFIQVGNQVIKQVVN